MGKVFDTFLATLGIIGACLHWIVFIPLYIVILIVSVADKDMDIFKDVVGAITKMCIRLIKECVKLAKTGEFDMSALIEYFNGL